jgi:hypothetical protein
MAVVDEVFFGVVGFEGDEAIDGGAFDLDLNAVETELCGEADEAFVGVALVEGDNAIFEGRADLADFEVNGPALEDGVGIGFVIVEHAADGDGGD